MSETSINEEKKMPPIKVMGGHGLTKAEKKIITEVLRYSIIDETAGLMYNPDEHYWFSITFSWVDNGPLTEKVHEESLKEHMVLSSYLSWLKNNSPDFEPEPCRTLDVLVAELEITEDGRWEAEIYGDLIADLKASGAKILG